MVVPLADSALACRFHLTRAAFTLAVDLKIPLHGITAIFGPSGSGKSSLLRCLAGLEREAKGFMRFGDRVWQSEKPPMFVPLYQRSVGMVFQDGRLFSHLTVAGNLAFARQRAAGRTTPPQPLETAPDMTELLAVLDLEKLLPRRPEQLSGGERQRVALGRALLTNPALLLMDEPLASVDGPAKQRILDYLRQRHRCWRQSMIYVSHDMGEIRPLADQVIFLEDGRIVKIQQSRHLALHTFT